MARNMQTKNGLMDSIQADFRKGNGFMYWGAALAVGIIALLILVTGVLLDSLVDIESHMEAWLCAYLLSILMTLVMTAMDAVLTLVRQWSFVKRKSLLGGIVRVVVAVYRVITLAGHGMALVMGVFMAMRLAEAPVAALMIALHLALMLTGYFGVRRMGKLFEEDAL